MKNLYNIRERYNHFHLTNRSKIVLFLLCFTFYEFQKIWSSFKSCTLKKKKLSTTLKCKNKNIIKERVKNGLFSLQK